MSDQVNPIRKKIATLAIPVLALVCGYIVYTNVFARTSPNAASKSHKTTPAASTSGVAKQGNASTQKSPRQRSHGWPTYTLDEIVGHSPFDPLLNSRSSTPIQTSRSQDFLMKSIPQSITTSTPTSFSASSNQMSRTSASGQPGRSKGSASGKAAPSELGGGLQAVFKSENGISALVDSKVVRPGDSINGVKIIAITPSAIFLEDNRTIQTGQGKK